MGTTSPTPFDHGPDLGPGSGADAAAGAGTGGPTPGAGPGPGPTPGAGAGADPGAGAGAGPGIGPVAAGLIDRLAARRARIGVVGLGYVGLPLALRFAEVGFPVSGFDIDTARVATLAAGRSPLHAIPDARIVAAGIAAQTDLAAARDCDALLVCVPTPIGPHKEPDLSAVRRTLAGLSLHLRPGQAVALESSTYPGTTEGFVVPALRAAGLMPGVDGFALYSPEREDPGNPAHSVSQVPKLVAGHSPACLEVAKALYGPVAGTLVACSSLAVAELAKLYENVFRAVNIGLVNELKRLAHAMDLDVHEVIDAAATKPFGFMPFRPGPGLGGHCIPVDPWYLAWTARSLGLSADFIELAGRVNEAMPGYVVERLRDALDRRGRTLAGAAILLLGLAYKPEVADTRESPSIEVYRLLAARGARIDYHDPLVPRFPVTRRLGGTAPDLASRPLSPRMLAGYDAVLLLTPHRAIDLEMVRHHARLVVDTRGVLRGLPRPPPASARLPAPMPAPVPPAVAAVAAPPAGLAEPPPLALTPEPSSSRRLSGALPAETGGDFPGAAARGYAGAEIIQA